MTTKINDYVDKVNEKFPEFSKSEIKIILVYGWKMILQCINALNDFYTRDKDIFFFIGKIGQSSLTSYKIYVSKLARRIRYMFHRTKSEWDGYYYFARGEDQFKDYLKQSKKKYKIFKDVFLYKLLEEVKIAESAKQYIFRLDEDKTKYMQKYYKEIKTDKAELIIQRDPLTLKDIMTSLNKYKYLQ